LAETAIIKYATIAEEALKFLCVSFHYGC